MSLVQLHAHCSDEHTFKFNAVLYADENECHDHEEKAGKTPESSASPAGAVAANHQKAPKSGKVSFKIPSTAEDTLTLNGLVSPPLTSPRGSLLSPDGSKPIQFPHQTQAAADEHNLIRLVSQRECWILRNNIITVLKENNFTLQHEFNAQEFVEIFQLIFPSSSKPEICKLFNLLTSTDENLLSFDFVLHNDENFHLLLESLGCRISNDENDQINIQGMDADDNVHNTQTNTGKRNSLCLDVADKSRGSRTITPRYSPMHREHDANKPVLSWKQEALHNNEYLEYIEYQRDIIDTLRAQINDTYKPLLLQNKETQLTLQSMQNENETLKQENEALSNEISDLQEQLQAIKEQEDEQQQDQLLQLDLHRNVSDSFAEIQQSHELLHNEVKELNHRIQLTRKLSNQTTTENMQLSAANDKYVKLTQQLNDSLKRLRTELNECKTTLQSKTQEINQLKCEVFEKEQLNQELHKTCNDLTQQMQFYQTKSSHPARSSRRRSKDYDMRVMSVRSTSVRSNFRSNSNYVEFDIFTDLLSSPRKQDSSMQTGSNATTPKYQSWSEMKWRSMSRELPANLPDDLVEDAKGDLIETLRTELSELQKKYDRDMVHLRTSLRDELEARIRSELEAEMTQKIITDTMKNPQKLEKATVHSKCQQNEHDHVKAIKRRKYKRSVATQTTQRRQLGFWEKFFAEIRCLPLDENQEW